MDNSGSITSQARHFLAEQEASFTTEVQAVDIYGLPTGTVATSGRAMIDWEFTYEERPWGIKRVDVVPLKVRVSWLREVTNGVDGETHEVPDSVEVATSDPQ